MEEEGIANLCRALQDEKNAAARKAKSLAPTSKIAIADFADERYQAVWDVEHVGVAADTVEANARKSAYSQTRAARRRRQALDTAEAFIDDADMLVFEGAVYSRGGYAELGGDVGNLPHGADLAGTEGLLLRLKGDAHNYSLSLGKTNTLYHNPSLNLIEESEEDSNFCYVNIINNKYYLQTKKSQRQHLELPITTSSTPPPDGPPFVFLTTPSFLPALTSIPCPIPAKSNTCASSLNPKLKWQRLC